MNQTELAWAAGFWDGEGCCCLTTNRKCRTKLIRLYLPQSFSPECLIRFQQAVGGLGQVRGPYTRSGNPNSYWTWSSTKTEDIQRVMELLSPYLSSPKLDQYERAAEARATSISHLSVVNKPTKEELERMYWVEEMTLKRIGKEIGVTAPCVSKWMKQYEIPSRRSKSSKKTPILTN